MNWNSFRTFSLMLMVCAIAQAQVPITPVMNIPNTGQQITPLAPRGARFTYLNPGLAAYPNYNVGRAVTTVTSPDKKTLLVLTSGDYGAYAAYAANGTTKAINTDWVFVYDITNPVPVQKQVLQVTNTYNGIVFDPSGTAFYVAGGRDSNVHIFGLSGGVWAEQAGSPVSLNISAQVANPGAPHPVSLPGPEAAGIAITQDGTKLVVTNYENDSISVLTKSSSTWSKTADFDLRPGKINPPQSGVPGGAFPFWVSIMGNSRAYVSCMRDREIDVVDISATPLLITRIPLTGQPLKSTLNAAQDTLYVAEDQADSVAVIETSTNSLKQEVKVGAPKGVIPPGRASLSGNNTNSVTLSPDEQTLYVTNGNTNNVAVLGLPLNNASQVLGLIPTGMYPNSVSVSVNSKYLYVANGKSPAGPNPQYCSSFSGNLTPPVNYAPCSASNTRVLQLMKAGLQFVPVPPASQLTALTQQVAINNNYQSTESPSAAATMNFVASKIQHVIYIIKENRTYDQVLGDLSNANGDSALNIFPASITPNEHNLARNFVTLDNLYATAEVSYDGWAWSTSALIPDIVIRQVAVYYSLRGGLAYDAEGDNRNVNLVYRMTGFSPQVSVTDPDILPGLTNVAAPDGPGNQVNTGYLWDQALRAGLTVRNYGFFVDSLGNAVAYPGNTTVRQVNPSNPALNTLTDIYFRGYDMNNADYYLYEEWARDVAANGLASLSLIRLPHDHMGNFGTALAGVNTPELQVADNDYAVGKVIETIAGNPAYASNTLIFVIEDDAQDGADHVDAHRTTAYIVGPYVKQGGAVVSTQYNTFNFIRTMERVLGLGPIHLTDGVAQPMADVFDITQAAWTFTAVPAPILYTTTLPLPPQTGGLRIPKPTHDAQYWARVTKGMDFSDADRVNPQAFNRILWKGLKGDTLYPGDANVAETRNRYKEALREKTSQAPTDRDGD